MQSAASYRLLNADWLRFYFDPCGRASRRDYNVRGLVLVLVGMMITAWLDKTLFSDGRAIFNDIWSYAATLLTVAVTSRRLHDLNWSGWWQLPFQLLILGVTFAMDSSDIALNTPDDAMAILDGMNNVNTGVYLEVLGGGALFILFFGVLSFLHGTKGANKYGADPLAGDASA